MKIEFEFPLSLITDRLSSFLKKIDIYHVILISAIMRFFCMSFPSDGYTIWDEFYYTEAVQDILMGKYGNPEHPPLTKLMVAVFVWVFGNHWFAWRFPIVICSLISTYLLYLLVRRFLGDRLALLAASFLIFDIIFFIHGNIFILEPLAIVFCLSFILLYLKGRYGWSAVMFSLACLANEKSLLFLFVVGFYHLLINLDLKVLKNITNRAVLQKFGVFSLIFLIVGGGGLWVTDVVLKPIRLINYEVNVHKTIFNDDAGTPIKTETATNTFTNEIYATNPIQHVVFMWDHYDKVSKIVDVTVEGYRPPWSWITPFGADPFNNRDYYTKITSLEEKRYYPIRYTPQTPLPIWYMTIPIIGLALYQFKEKESKFILSWIAITYLPWFIKTLFTHTCSWNKNFILTLPIICFGIPWFWNRVGGRYKYLIMLIHLAITIIFFLKFFPVSVIKPGWVDIW